MLFKSPKLIVLHHVDHLLLQRFSIINIIHERVHAHVHACTVLIIFKVYYFLISEAFIIFHMIYALV